MSAALYFACFLLFGVGCAALLFALLMFERLLPGGPADACLTTPMTTDLAVNTAVSFSTTTTWQAYAGEKTLRYLAQVMGLVAQNFLAGAAGLAVGFAFIRGLARDRSATIGNFWVDLIRSLLALAGRFAAQRHLPTTAGTLPNDTPTFGALVFGTILLGGALSFLPALALGPVGEFLRH